MARIIATVCIQAIPQSIRWSTNVSHANRINETMETSTAAGGGMYHFLACTVSQYMTRSVKAVTRQTTMRELEALFEKHDFNAFPVVEDGRCLGIVSKFDFLRAFAFTSSQMVPHYNELMGRPVTDVMTEAVVHVDPASPLTRVLQLMVGLKARSFPVAGTDHQLEGMISREDVMRALKETQAQYVGDDIFEIITLEHNVRHVVMRGLQHDSQCRARQAASLGNGLKCGCIRIGRVACLFNY